MLKKILFLCFSLCFSVASLHAQTSYSVSGNIYADSEALPFATVQLLAYPDRVVAITSANADGRFTFSAVAKGRYKLIARALGYKADTLILQLDANKTVALHLAPVSTSLNPVVVSATRNRIPLAKSPITIHTIGAETFEQSQAASLADGLTFSPGLRVENNCQNCGFTQLRMNGLQGPYTQILVNSRPMFSALAGVYGLEMIPADWVERVEVIKGGGSVAFGGNAIAGTVNIITKKPESNGFGFSANQGFVDMEIPDRTLSVNASVVTPSKKAGFSLYGFRRMRNEWDANGDLFSEITRLRNTSLGSDFYYDVSKNTQLTLRYQFMDEFRRGGNRFDLQPHETDITEQLQHNVHGLSLDVDHVFPNDDHSLSSYFSMQHTKRASYYGGGGRVLSVNDTLTQDDITAMNAYGESTDITYVAGVQYDWQHSKKYALQTGVEHRGNRVDDVVPGYNRSIRQQVYTTGLYTQLDWKPLKHFNVLAGGRLEHLAVRANHQLANELYDDDRQLFVFVPRISARLQLPKDIVLRASFAQGYRGPQAFDEDLHIETVGGAARFIQLSDSLQTERSNSLTLSANYTLRYGAFQFQALAEGFYTRLANTFVLSNPVALPNGTSVLTKRNGSAATVYGLNTETTFAYGEAVWVQSGFTWQGSRYARPEVLWEPVLPTDERKATTTQTLLRNPKWYGFINTTFKPTKRVEGSAQFTFTGPMDVPHVINAEDEYTVIKQSPTFTQVNLRLAYHQPLGKESKMKCTISAGIQNVFNAFQSDLDLGPLRDAGYIYGPRQPRTLVVGLAFRTQ